MLRELNPICSHGRRKDFFQGGVARVFFQIFSKGGPKVSKFDFSPSKLRKQPFFAGDFKIQGAKAPPPLFPTPMFAVLPLRKFYTEQIFVFLSMQLRNHAHTQPVKRFKW